MRLLYWGKDGGDESTVWGFWPIEIKSLFSVALLVFKNGSREAYHTHAFDSISWVLGGKLIECELDGPNYTHLPSIWPIVTKRETFHKVIGCAKYTVVLTFRGPWTDVWKEYIPPQNRTVTLTNGRVEV